MSNNQPKVTVLVPSYNHARYINERIESILNQTYSNIELIVIDDCSQDNSHTIINKLQTAHNFKYIRRSKNSGTPFSAWEDICTLATGKYIWICESDDVADTKFLETAIKKLLNEPNSAIYYCSSIIINKEGEHIGHTDNYFHDIWKEKRWDNNFTNDGLLELLQFQLKGQTVPNMSSAVIPAPVFKKAFSSHLKNFRLTGDWLFVGEVLKLGTVIFNHTALSYFREHEITSRVRVQSARSQAEFILTKYRLFRGSNQPNSMFSKLMGSDVIRFLYEPPSWYEVTKELIKVSWLDTLRFGWLFFISTCQNKPYINKFKERYKHAKSLDKT